MPGSLPMLFDPVEQRKQRVRLTPRERVKEAIYAWVETEADSPEEYVAWKHLYRAIRVWLGNSRHHGP